MSISNPIYYSVAGLELCIDRDLMYAQVDAQPRCRVGSFAPFQRDCAKKTTPDMSARLLMMESSDNAISKSNSVAAKHLHSFEFSDVKAMCHFYSYPTSNGCNYLLAIESEQGELITEFEFDTQNATAVCRAFRQSSVGINSPTFSAYVRFGLWLMLGIAAAKHHIAAVHSSTIIYNGQAIMFLGESGTGKSTHTRLWRENIEGATLLNDDSPFIGIVDGRPTIYGSPWSGKTPCYKDESYPLRAIVRLSQAPHNKISRIKGIVAIGALLPSLPPAFAYDSALKEEMYEILNKVLPATELYHLECLPNAEAAYLVCKTLFEV